MAPLQVETEEETNLWVSNMNAMSSPSSLECKRHLLGPNEEINQAASLLSNEVLCWTWPATRPRSPWQPRYPIHHQLLLVAIPRQICLLHRLE
jgi:hypothetical protein